MSPHSEEDRPAFDEPHAALDPGLEQMLAEVRAERPNIDWDQVEARLFAPDGEVMAPRKKSWALVAALAIAAAFAFALLSPTGAMRPEPTVAKTAERAPLLRGGAPLAVGAVIEGGFEGTWLRALGRVSVRFEPGSYGRLLDDGERVRFALESGALVADVIPVPGGEPFAVDVLGKRVAVHGTHLRVAVVDGKVEVAVSEGSAVVGEPAGDGRTEGALVEAGSVGTFAESAAVLRDPARAQKLVEDALAVGKARPVEVAKVGTPPAPTVPAKTETNLVLPNGVPSAAVSAAPAQGLSDAQLKAPFAAIDTQVKKCPVPSTGSGSTATFENDVTLEISPAGKITGATMGDVAPEYRDCVRRALDAAVFPTATTKTTVRKKIVLAPK